MRRLGIRLPSAFRQRNLSPRPVFHPLMAQLAAIPIREFGKGLQSRTEDAKVSCPPSWVLRLAALRTGDDDLLFAHMRRCARCFKIFAETSAKLQE